MDPKVIVLVAVLGGGYVVGDAAVKGIKKVDHVIAKAGVKLWHGVKHVVGH